MSGMQPGDHDGAYEGPNSHRQAAFHVFDDLRSLQDSEHAWADLFACMQQQGESVHDYGNRVIGLAHQLTDLDPALYDCLVFHRVKAGLRKPIRDVLLLNTVQPNSHAMLDQIVWAIEQKLQPADQPFGINNITPSLTPTLNWNNVQRSRIDGGGGPAAQTSNGPSANAMRFNDQQQEQPWQHGPAAQQHPHENEPRAASQASPTTNHAEHDAFQIRGLHQTRPPPPRGPENQHPLLPTQNPIHADHYSPTSNPNEVAASMLGRHEVQHTPTPFKGTKRPGSDGGSFQNDGNEQTNRKKIPWQDFQRKKQQGPPICFYCKEVGHMKDACSKNPRNMV
ncbi:MAG: hypothetical protein Q9169_007452 [Polycauliona sp. 2 TL-2023]